MTVQRRFFSRPADVTAESCQRTFQCRFLLRADPTLNSRLVGILARAQKAHGVYVHAFATMSSHVHVLATYADAESMALFHCYLFSNLSKEVTRVHGWDGTVFPKRYSHVELSREEEIEQARLKYVLGQGCKEGLVASPLDWPGASSTEALVSGEMVMKGTWVDRTRLSKARAKGREVKEEDFTSEETLVLTPLPCLAHLSRESYRRFVLGLVRQIEEETEAKHKVDGTCPLGPEAVLAMKPRWRPLQVKESPRPWFFAFSEDWHKAMSAAMTAILLAYETAAEKLKKIDWKDPDRGSKLTEIRFPAGTFPSKLPFVREEVPLRPG